MMDNENSTFHMTTNRIEALTDGIFAIAMTLLVLTLAVPNVSSPLSNTAVQNALYDLTRSLLTLVLSFVLLALFWSVHHRVFQRIREVDTILLWINMIWLLFIVLVPFSATLTGKYGEFTISHLVFNMNMLGISVFLFLNTYYADRSQFVHEKVDPTEINMIKRDNILFIVISLVAIALSFVIPSFTGLVYILIFPLEYVLHKL